MKKTGLKFFLLILAVPLFNCRNTREVALSELHPVRPLAIDSLLDQYLQKYDVFLNDFRDTTRFPRSYTKGKVVTTGTSEWTSGFFPGILWKLFDYSRSEKIRNDAISWTRSLESEKVRYRTDEIGIIIGSSFGQAYELTKDPYYSNVILQSASSLAKRYDPVVGCLRSVEVDEHYKFPVLINNLVNLEILFKAWKWEDDRKYYDMATSHLLRTIENQFRKDFSIYQLVDYNRDNGSPELKGTIQGYQAESNWSQGLAWALYGFCMAYRETEDRLYLDQGERIADYIIQHLDLDNKIIPLWDLTAPGIPDEPRDAACAAILASSLADLVYWPETEHKEKYKVALDRLISSLISGEYLAGKAENGPFMLKHCIWDKPAGREVDVSLIYADYYFLESLMKYRRLLIINNQ